MRLLLLSITLVLLVYSPLPAQSSGFSPVIPTKAKQTATATQAAPKSQDPKEDDFEAQLRQQLYLEQEKLNNLILAIGEAAHLVSPAQRLEFKHVLSMVEVKQTLVNNFVGTPSLESPAIRSMLMQIMKQHTVSQEHLLILQNLVQVEKTKLAARKG